MNNQERRSAALTAIANCESKAGELLTEAARMMADAEKQLKQVVGWQQYLASLDNPAGWTAPFLAAGFNG